MKKSIKIFLILFISLFTFNVNALELNINSKHAIMYNLDNNELLYEKYSEEKVQIASLTKIMTAIVTLENVDDIDKQIIMKSEDFYGLAAANLVTAGFTVGEAVTYKDLLYGLLLPSGADAAKALSRNIGGSEAKFIQMMNDKAKELKLENTSFSNPIGLDDENNYSTVKELSIIFKKALENQDFKTIITTKEYTTTDGKLKFKSTIQSNASKYGIEIPYILGGKTGTTNGAGLCLASIANENNVNYLLVTTGALYDKKSPHHIEDAKIIYDYFIQNYSNQKIVDKTVSYKTLKTKYSKEKHIKLYPSKNIIKYLPNDYNKDDVKFEYNGVEEVTPSTETNLGTLKIYYQDEIISEEKVSLKEKIKFSLTEYIKEEKIKIIIASASIVVLIIIVIIIKKRK